MSHRATNWAIVQRGLKPAVKIVLWYLCDRHNKDHGCFPSQETLVEDCEVSRPTLNRHLAELEELRLIRRVQRSDRKTRKQKSTMYLFAFDFEDPYAFDPSEDAGEKTSKKAGELGASPCLKMRHGSVSQNEPIPCLKKRDSRVSNRDTNPVKEPLKNQRAIPEAAPLSKIAAFWINAIRDGRIAGCQAIRPDVAQEIALSGLLDPDQLKAAGIASVQSKNPRNGDLGQ